MSHSVSCIESPLSEGSPSSFVLPDLVSDCPFPFRSNPLGYKVARASEQWLIKRASLPESRAAKFLCLKAGELAAACFPDADESHLHVCSDFMNWLFMIDDWLDEFDVKDAWRVRDCCIAAFRDPIHFQTDKLGGLMSKSFFSRFIQTGGPRCTERFIQAMDLFFAAVAQQADDRIKDHIPDIEAYITVRRDTSGCKPCFALIEYAARIDLPDEVISHPVIMAMEEATNDFATWSNDLFSYNVEQSRGDTHNIIVILMRQRGWDLQTAIDYVGELCMSTVRRFEENRAILPSWGDEIDRQVEIYIQGLQDWIVGPLHWSFDSERYFGKNGLEVKQHRRIELLPKRPL